MHRVEFPVGVRGHLSGGQVEHSPTADGGQLVPVTDQCDPSVVFVGDGQQCAGGVLVEHAGLVNEQHVARGDHGIVARAGRRRRRCPRRCHRREAWSTCRSRAIESRAGEPTMPPTRRRRRPAGPPLGPPSASVSPPVAGHRAARSRQARRPRSWSCRRPPHPRSRPDAAPAASVRTTSRCTGSRPASASVAIGSRACRRCRGAAGETGGKVGFDLENIRRGQRTDVLGHAGTIEQGDALGDRSSRQVLGQLEPNRTNRRRRSPGR